jgi:hypothetical protein
VIAAIALWAAASALPAAAQDEPAAVVSAETSLEETADGGERVRVDVLVTGVEDLGAFEFVLAFDGTLLAVEEDAVVEGAFLGSSGRDATCLPLAVDPNAVRYECVTFGSQPRQGASGEGVLGTLYFELKGEGDAVLQFTRAQLSNPEGRPIPSRWTEGEIRVNGGSDNVIWPWLAGGAGGLALVAVAAGVAWWRRGRGEVRQGAPLDRSET